MDGTLARISPTVPDLDGGIAGSAAWRASGTTAGVVSGPRPLGVRARSTISRVLEHPAFAPECPHVVVVGHVADHDMDPQAIQCRASRWTTAIRSLDERGIAIADEDELVAVVPATTGVERVPQRILEHLPPPLAARLVLGVSHPFASREALERAHEEAQQAALIGAARTRPDAITHFRQLGVTRLFALIPDRTELGRFVEETLAGVLDLPDAERDDLLHTLEVLLDSRLNTAEAARSLHFHYNTLRYRIAKLERLIGSFTDDSEACLEIWSALHARRFLACV